MPKVSIAIPVYDMPNADFFLDRCLASIESQTFRDFDVVITNQGKMAENTNAAIKEATGDLIKILYMDDYFNHKDALQMIVDAFDGNWLVTGCNHNPGTLNHLPSYQDEIQYGVNTIGSPSVMTIKNDKPLLFDEDLGWLLDCDYYKRMFDIYGLPVFLNDINVTIGVGEHQATHLMGDEIKINEQKYMERKYE